MPSRNLPQDPPQSRVNPRVIAPGGAAILANARMEAVMDETGRGLDIQQFLVTPSRREQEFCVSDLLSQLKHTIQSGASAANGWQLRGRVLKRFRWHCLHDA